MATNIPDTPEKRAQLETINEAKTLKALGFRRPELVQKMVKLRLTGMSYSDIAESLEVDELTVRDYLKRVFEKVVAPNVNELRETMAHQIDNLIHAYYQRALLGEVGSAQLVLKAISQKAKLYDIGQGAGVNVNVNIRPPWETVYDAVLVNASNVIDSEAVEYEQPNG